MTNQELLEAMQSCRVPKNIQKGVLEGIKDQVSHVVYMDGKIRLRMGYATYSFETDSLTREN